MRHPLRTLALSLATAVAISPLTTAPAHAEGGVVTDPAGDGVVEPGGTFDITRLEVRHKAQRVSLRLESPGYGTRFEIQRPNGRTFRLHSPYDGGAIMDNGPCRGRWVQFDTFTTTDGRDGVAVGVPRHCLRNPQLVRARAIIGGYDQPVADATRWSRWLKRG